PEWSRPKSTTPDPSEGPHTPTTSRETEETTRPTRPAHRPPSHPNTSVRPPAPSKPPVEEVEEIENEINEIKCDRDFIPSKDCRSYYRCVYGKPLKFQCQAGLVYNPEKMVCDWPENVENPLCNRISYSLI
ncbi:endochitinase-like, partial [Copidosoma floridanum]|uniref:endochitinase-like n=1 Tax=Copidosoma floridanum TaxID=29053 RepID=UPI0006C9B529